MANKVATFSERFKEAIEINHLRQIEISKATNIGKSSISSYLSGEYEPKHENLEILAKVLGVDIEWLSGYDVDMIKKNSDNTYVSSNSSESYPYCDFSGYKIFQAFDLSAQLFKSVKNSSNSIVLEMNDEGLNKIIPKNSYLIVDTEKNCLGDFKSGDYIVIQDDDTYIVRKYYVNKEKKQILFKPNSNNEDYFSLVYDYKESIKLKFIGKIISYIVNL